MKNFLLGTFRALKNSSKNVISRIRYNRFGLCRYIRYTLYPEFACVKSAMGCVIVEGDSLALLTALENSPRNVLFGIRYIRFALNPVWVVLLSKGTP